MVFFFSFSASRLAVHVIKWSKTLPDPDHFKHSVIISVIIHGSSLAILNLVTYGLWVAIALCGNVAHQFLFKLTQWPISAGMVLPALQKFPISVGFLFISMAHASCGGLALICAVIMYFILLSKMYEDYLEEFVYKTAAVIAEKLFGKKSDPNKSQASVNTAAIAIAQPNNDQANKNTNDTTSEAKTNDADEGVGTRKTQRTNDSSEKKQLKENKKDKKKEKKKVGFTENDETESKNDKSESIDETPSSAEVESKLNEELEVKEGAIVPSGSQESFEVLYNQLDPNDVAMFSRSDEVEEMNEEERLQMEKAEEGLN